MPEIADVVVEDGRWENVDIQPLAQRAFTEALARLGLEEDGFEIALLACDDTRIAELNKEFRAKAVPTNVLSWPEVDLSAEDDGGTPDLPDKTAGPFPETLGDIAIAYETCTNEARDQNKDLADHVMHLLVHGCLHLLGYDHVSEKDAAVMEGLEVEILAKLGIANPYCGNSVDQTDFWIGVMGEIDEGSSMAAQSAQKTETPHRQSFFDRLFGNARTDDEQGNPLTNGIQLESNGHSLSPAGGMGNLNRVRIQDVAVPRADMISVAVDIKLDALVTVFRDSGLTRLPVFRDTLDTPLGFVHLKDLALKHGFACDDGVLDLKTMLRPLLFAPPSMPIGVLLQKMQTDRIHMALVIDEYGGVDGLVTIEDLIEQVIGEIEDEHDIEEEAYWTVEKPGVYLCNAKTPLEDFEAETGVKLIDLADDDEIDSLGGLVFLLSGRVAGRGEVIKHASGVEFEVIDADPRRIKRLRVVLPPLKGS